MVRPKTGIPSGSVEDRRYDPRPSFNRREEDVLPEDAASLKIGSALIKPTLQAILSLCFAAFVLVACSEDAAETDRSQAGPASGGDSGGTAKARTVPEEGTLPAGRYSVGERFDPSFSFELGEGWLLLRSSDPNSLRLGYVAPGQEVAQGKGLRFLNLREIFEPRKQAGDVLFEAKPVPENLVAWLQQHPYIGTEGPAPAEVGGVPGRQLDADVDLPEGYCDARAGGCAVPCLPLLRPGIGSVTYITEKGKDRFIILDDIQGEAVIIIISAPAGKFVGFAAEARVVLQTVVWERN